MTIGENLGNFWSDLLGGQKLLVIFAAVLLFAAIGSGWWSWFQTSMEVRKFEREAAVAKLDAENALKIAADIGKEKLEKERQLAEVEAKRDGKVTELEKAKIETLDARAEYNRAVREQRTDNPSAEQLCRELAALGHPCR